MAKAFLHWSSGKDASMALYEMQQAGQQIDCLFTTISQAQQRVTMHGLPLALVEAQAQSIGLPLRTMMLPSDSTHQSYEGELQSHYRYFKSNGYNDSYFGDIFLEDLRAYRQKLLQQIPLNGHYPLWGRNTTQLMNAFIELGFRAIVVSANSALIPKELLGETIDQHWLSQLPDSVDPCGENGEFHTFCYDGPIFSSPIAFEQHGIVEKTYGEQIASFYFTDIRPIS